ncbi:hypothetical protein [Stenotrophomonas indicatrix]|uniref:hypothetical protein n=1 Tax=Stenotrophomonas indicatrix TaxID=2045451 RepID=UPI00289A26DF|nr:hypothetical protein [Stenotrophomonas indicatrix]
MTINPMPPCGIAWLVMPSLEAPSSRNLLTNAVDQSAAETPCTARLRSSLPVRKKIAIIGAAASATIGMPAIDASERFEFWLCAG